MPVTIRKLHPLFVGEVTGVDLTKPVSLDDAAAIERGMDDYAVLIFPKQDITDEQQLAFAQNFGERENRKGGSVTKKEDYRLTSGLADVSNLGKDGKPLPKDSRTHLFNLGNCLWHSDSSFRPIPANSRCSRHAWSIRRAATPNSPTCARPMMRSTVMPRPRSRT